MKFVVVVTGASSGLGCMTALAHSRHTVYVSMRDTAGRNASQVSEITASYAGELARWGIETTIVVPGAFTKGTNRFAHAEAPADEARVEEYAEGPTKDIPTIAMKGLAALEPKDADPQAVANTIAAVVDMPFRAEEKQPMIAMRYLAIRIAVSLVASCASGASNAQLTTHKDLIYQVGKAIAEETLASCANRGYAISVVVVDRAGQTVIALRADNASPHTMENARRKAYTAMTFRVATTAYAKRFADNDPVVRQQVTLPNVIAIGGGLPIKMGDEVIGGAGASGSPGVDEACVQTGLDRVANYVK